MRFTSETFRITFRRRADIIDITGGTTKGDYGDIFTRYGSVRQTTGREIAEGGKSEDSIDCIIRVRDDAMTRTVTASDRVNIRGNDFDLITVGLPDRRDGSIEMTARRQIGGN